MLSERPFTILPEEGLEPTLSCENGILNPARLPIPPLRLRVGRPASDPQRALLYRNPPKPQVWRPEGEGYDLSVFRQALSRAALRL